MSRLLFGLWIVAMLALANTGSQEATALALAGLFVGTGFYWLFGRGRR